jgi:hypothetical protein
MSNMVLIFALLSSISPQAFGQTVTMSKPLAHELFGFMLRQNRTAIEQSLGKPFAEQKGSDGWIGYAYHVPAAEKSYLVAFYDEQRVTRVELTGTDYRGTTGFFGLRLGDSSDKALSVLGKPSDVSHEDDVDVDLWEYRDANYSLEFTKDHKLYSIQVVDEPSRHPQGFSGSAEVRSFAEALHSHDIDTLMQMSSGEIECSDGEASGLENGAARAVLADDRSSISSCLRRAADVVLALGGEMMGVEDEIRIWTKHNPGVVTKFPADCPLKEVVFVQETGAWRVYELTFR